MNIIYINILLFLFYSFLGWIIEVTNFLITRKKFINRGFLIGPYCPIYGVGSLLVISFLKDYLSRPFGLFVMSIVICSLIEYFGSLFMEKIFHTRWWDYSSKKFNINGRICLETMIPFGIGCLLIMYYINPFISNLLLKANTLFINILAIILGIFFLIDFILSFIIIFKFRTFSKDNIHDSTEKVNEYVRNEFKKIKRYLYIRLFNSFPSLKIIFKNKK